METEKPIYSILDSLGEEIEDVTEETFFLFSQDFPSQNLGMVDDKSGSITVEVAGHEYELRQSSGLLASNREGGTTGAVLWKITPLLANWLTDKHNCLWNNGILSKNTTVVELGCGVAGLLGMALAPLVSRYILTDQEYVMKILRENINSNLRQVVPKKSKKVVKRSNSAQTQARNNLDVMALDWETDTTRSLRELLSTNEGINLVVVCDCVYNSFLIPPLAQICTEICDMDKEKQTVLLIAQQLRSDEVFQEWMESLVSTFRVWRLSDNVIPTHLSATSGYTVHIAALR